MHPLAGEAKNGVDIKGSAAVAALHRTPCIHRRTKAAPGSWADGDPQHPAPLPSLPGTYRAVEFAFAIHGYEEATLHAKEAHHPPFHWRDLKQTCGRCRRSQIADVLQECGITLLRLHLRGAQGHSSPVPPSQAGL